MKYIDSRCELKDIHDTLVKVCNAIVSVINVDITIVDNHLNRITGTGEYIVNIGERLGEHSIFSYALERGEKFIIENPRHHEACIKCEDKPECKEWAQVCCPIVVDNRIIGIIGLIAFNREQRDIIIQNKNNLLEFLSRMADLIAAKVKENRETKKVRLMANELEILVNSMDAGVISTDENGNILRYNSIAQEIFTLRDVKSTNLNICQLIEGMDISNIRERKAYINNKVFIYKVNEIELRGFYNAKPIIVNNRVNGFIFTFNKMKEIIRVINDVASTNMITSFEDIIGGSKEINMVKKYARKISKGSSTVLLQGESGTGKELFARAIHYESHRRNHPFVAVNCTALPENLIESELFGYEEGAFTGAKRGGKIGKFELANKGTIFLDEIGDMPLHLQTKLLRVLQENTIERVGGNAVIPVDVRVIAASNKMLENKVKENEFREDLFYRLNVIPIYLPPLRERIEDIEILAYRFLRKFNHKLGRAIEGLHSSVIDAFKSYEWPGNVRELENAVEYGVNMCTEKTIKIQDLPRRIKERKIIKDIGKEEIIRPIKELEKIEIIKALERFGNDKEGIRKATQELGISRATIYRKIKAYGIDVVSK